MELAGGTLLLDEVGDIPLELQPKLLRVLQDHEFERLGGTRTIEVDLRIIAATNRDLPKLIERHQFRSDLFYRLNVFPIRVPPLRERRGDIPMPVRYFVRKYALGMARNIETIPSETMKALVNWQWPGNVGESENVVERSVILTEGKTLRVPLSELVEERQNADPANHTLERAEREHIIRALRECIGLVSGPTGAAHRLGLTFFCAFSTEVLGSLDVSSRHSVLPAGPVLFVEGQMRRVVFVLCSGGVKALNGGTLVIRNRTACKP